MKDFFVWKALGLAVPVILGPLTYLVGRAILNGFTWLDQQNAIIKRSFIIVLAIVLAALAQMAGLTLPSECAIIGTGQLTSECQSALANPVFLKGALGALVAFAMHYLKKA